MTNYKNLGYAVNAKSENIEYAFLNEKNLVGSVSVTLDDFLAGNPGKTPDDYVELKRISDENYLEEKRNDYNTTHLNLNIEWAEQKGECFCPSPEDELITDIEEQEERERKARRRELGLRAFGELTEVQRRRYQMYHVEGLTMRQIADLEGVNHSKIQDSLNAADKKIKKFLASS
jgi:RNA polymerase sigma factor (sigma-70 family)